MKNKIIIFLLMFFIALTPVFAEDEILNDSIIIAGENSTYSKNNDGSALILGNVVEYDGNASGILVNAGNNVGTKGSGEYGVILGYTVDVNTKILKDSVIAGNTVTITGDFGRDVYVFGSNVKISGVINRNLTVYASKIEIDDLKVLGNVNIDCDEVIVSEHASVTGKLNIKYRTMDISTQATLGEVDYVKKAIRDNSLNKVKSGAINCASMLVVFAAIALIFPKLFTNINKEKLGVFDYITYIGYALVFLILVPVGALILMTLTIGIPLALILIALYIFIIYLAYAVTGYYVGQKLVGRFIKEDNLLLSGLVGIVLLYLVSLIPYVGPIVTFISYLLGIGIILFNFKK